MKEINISKHTKYSLEYIFKESDKLAVQILGSITEMRNKSFWLFAFISSLFSFSFIKVLDAELQTRFDYLILLIGAIVGGIILRKNLFPQKIHFNGALPENMLLSYFDEFENEHLEKELIATQIQSYNNAMKENRSLIDKMVNRFKRSVYSILVFFLLYGILFLFRFVESLPS